MSSLITTTTTELDTAIAIETTAKGSTISKPSDKQLLPSTLTNPPESSKSRRPVKLNLSRRKVKPEPRKTKTDEPARKGVEETKKQTAKKKKEKLKHTEKKQPSALDQYKVNIRGTGQEENWKPPKDAKQPTRPYRLKLCSSTEDFTEQDLYLNIAERHCYILGSKDYHRHIQQFIYIEQIAYVGSWHAAIAFCDEKAILYDLNSENGTFLDGHKLDPYQGYQIKEGSKMQFGSRFDTNVWDMEASYTLVTFDSKIYPFNKGATMFLDTIHRSSDELKYNHYQAYDQEGHDKSKAENRQRRKKQEEKRKKEKANANVYGSSDNSECEDEEEEEGNVNVTTSVDLDGQLVLHRTECSTCHEVMDSITCIPALLVCGHVATCITCYEKWNKDCLLNVCPMCKETQTISPIEVVFNEAYHQLDSTFTTKIKYVASYTCQHLSLSIQCKMSSSGDDLKTIVMSHLLAIDFPKEYLTLGFSIQRQSFVLHGNTTLCDVGFVPLRYNLWIQENYLPLEHILIQKKLWKVENSPVSKFKVLLRSTHALKLDNLHMEVEEHYTICRLSECVEDYLMKYESKAIVGKKLIFSFPKLGIDVTSDTTLGQLKICSTSVIYFNIIH